LDVQGGVAMLDFGEQEGTAREQMVGGGRGVSRANAQVLRFAQDDNPKQVRGPACAALDAQQNRR
jgi:hypothetical protein